VTRGKGLDGDLSGLGPDHRICITTRSGLSQSLPEQIDGYGRCEAAVHRGPVVTALLKAGTG
jgi:hypothetical protein